MTNINSNLKNLLAKHGKEFRKKELNQKKPVIKIKLKDPSKIKVKITDIGAGGKEYVRKDEMNEPNQEKN
tara:strand:- start:189 stop:398 length:210 start_codon:yes stop_codon:yes gene_type:complete